MDHIELKINGVTITIAQDGAAPRGQSETAAVGKSVAAPRPVGDDATYAAIAAAIHLYGQEWRDVENTVLTINKVSRAYSPWSAKFHGLNAYYKYKR